MKNTDLRPLTDKERAILEKLAEVDFPGRDQLKEQIQGLGVQSLDENGSLHLHTLSASMIPVKQGVLVEARCPDSDTRNDSEPHINILLHTKAGKITMLEIYKDDGTPINGKLDPNKFKLFSRYKKDN